MKQMYMECKEHGIKFYDEESRQAHFLFEHSFFIPKCSSKIYDDITRGMIMGKLRRMIHDYRFRCEKPKIFNNPKDKAVKLLIKIACESKRIYGSDTDFSQLMNDLELKGCLTRLREVNKRFPELCKARDTSKTKKQLKWEKKMDKLIAEEMKYINMNNNFNYKSEERLTPEEEQKIIQKHPLDMSNFVIRKH